MNLSNPPATIPSILLPWADRAGRLSVLKLIVFIAFSLPWVWISYRWWTGDLGPRPVTEAIHETGAWGTRLLLASLAVTPLRLVLHWSRLVIVRRMLGLAALLYLAVHFSLYVVDLKFDLTKIASEIALRLYLTIGFSALIGLVVLGGTSFDGVIRRLGPDRWNALHKAVYVFMALGLLHALLQSRLDISEPVLLTGLFLILLLVRRLKRWGGLNAVSLAAAGLFAAIATAALEALWYGIAKGLPSWRILAANLDFDVAIRPAWWVLLVGMLLALAAWFRLPRNAAPVRDSRGPKEALAAD